MGYSSLAMAEMTTLVSAVYRKYRTSVEPGSENKTPAITSRFEMFYDDSFAEIAVGALHVAFQKDDF